MPSMPIYFVGKGRQFILVDDVFGGRKRNYMRAYKEAMTRMQQPLTSLTHQHGAASTGGFSRLTPADAQHFEDHWITGWWPGKKVAEVLSAGYSTAIELAQARKLPIESLWVCASEDEFQMYVCEGPRQITVIVFTPPPPGPPENREHSQERLTKDEPIWVVKVKDHYDDEYTNQGGGPIETLDAANQIIRRRVRYAGP
jgi:hypothetical protein